MMENNIINNNNNSSNDLLNNNNNENNKLVSKVNNINSNSNIINPKSSYENSSPPSDCINLNNSNSTDHCDMTSLEILNKCHLDLFPKKKTICDDVQCMSIVDQLPILNGEYIQFIGPSGKTNDEILLITNYRIFLLMHNGTSFINVPIMLVESIEIRENILIYIYLKNAKTLRIMFNSNEKASIWCQRFNSIIYKSYKLEELFAFTFYSWLTNEKLDDSNENAKCLFSKADQTNIIYKEFKRMKFDSKIWRISDVNKKFELCPTYPEQVIVPKSITDEQLKKIACFRSSKRFPVVVWRSKINGAVLARSSQPNVGLLAWRLNEDEQLIKAISDSCSSNNNKSLNVNGSSYSNYNNSNSNNMNGSNSNNNNTNNVSNSTIKANLSVNGLSNGNTSINGNLNANDSNNKSTTTSTSTSTSQEPMLLIIDARFRTVALANRVKGGGYEYSEYYTNCEIQFMNLENIHVIRSSFQALRQLCQSVNDNKTLLSQLENTKWLHHLSYILKAALTVISAIDQHAKPVLIHCSDGWDRTPQILALSKLLLDPNYRTIDGFRQLVEVDWLLFGHKFSQRNGHAADHTDINERCPVFLQWLDCVYQIIKQFPSAFQFNELFLLKLCYHSYSCLFGTFMCDSMIERVNEHTDERTFSVWSYLNDKNKEIINYLYDDTFDEVLYPNCELVHMQLWQKLFCESDITYLVKVDKKEMLIQNFNDSIDGISSSPPLNSDSIMDPENNSRINSLLKNAIDSNSLIMTNSIHQHFNNDGSVINNSNNKDQQHHNSSLNLQQKTKSFDDLFKYSTSEDDGGGGGGYLSIAMCALNIDTKSNSSLNKKSSSESNLNINNNNNGCNISNGKPTMDDNEKKLYHTNTNTICKNSNDNIDGLNDLNNDDDNLINPIAHHNNSNNDDVFLQTSELKNELIKLQINNKEENSNHINGTTNNSNNNNKNIVVDSSSGSSSTSSTLPSPNMSNPNLKEVNNSIVMTRTLTDNKFVNISNNTNNNSNSKNEKESNSISTSTSGLSDYIESCKYKYINDQVRHFFNNGNGASSKSSNLVSVNKFHADIFNNEFYDFLKLNNNSNEMSNSKKTNGLVNGNGDSNLNKKASSNSIPIVNNKNKDGKQDYQQENKRNVKRIKDCIDIDGLTKVEDRTFKKIIERDESAKKEILLLKEQLNKCKWFFSKLANNPVWHDCSNDFMPINESNENSQSDENHSANNYSISNDSVCSSWDEIEESDYKLAAWVPDYYVTHCQNCNEKFSLRLRKHHCRNCGQVFCYKCADQFYPLPNHNLTAPVRVCNNCKLSIDKQNSMISNGSHSNNKPYINGKNHQSKASPQQALFNSPSLIFSSTPPNLNGDLFSASFELNHQSSAYNNYQQAPKLFNSIQIQKQQQQQQPILSTQTSTNSTLSNSSTNSTIRPIQGTPTSNNCNISIGSRCNQIDSNKFNKKNDNKSQKVSV